MGFERYFPFLVFFTHRQSYLVSDIINYIRTRLGLHDRTNDDTCSPSGILILQLACGENVAEELNKKLNAVSGVNAKLVNLG